MQRTKLGRTNLDVSVACLGSGGHSRLGQTRGASVADSVAIIRAAIDLGINFIDTAPRYHTEEIVGTGISGVRDEVVISTKCVVVKDGNAGGRGKLIDGDDFIRQVEQSLVRLKTDRIDIMQLHGVEAHEYTYCVNELVPAMIKLREAGKIRYLGITELFNIDTTHEMLKVAKDDVWDVIMVGYNFVNQTAASAVLPHTRERNIGTMCMYAVRGGLASLEQASQLLASLIESGEVDARDIDPADPFGFLQEDAQRIPISAAAYRFCRYTPGVDVVMTGTGNLDHLRDNVRAINAPPLPSEVMEKLRKVFRDACSLSGNPLARAS